MTVEDAIKTRYSVRSYSERAVEAEKIHQVLEAARLAPSASNRQEWRFVVVTDKNKRVQLAEAAAGQMFVSRAPCVIVCCAETDFHEMKCGQLTYPMDLAIAIDHMTLRAVELGLGTITLKANAEVDDWAQANVLKALDTLVASAAKPDPDDPVPEDSDVPVTP